MLRNKLFRSDRLKRLARFRTDKWWSGWLFHYDVTFNIISSVMNGLNQGVQFDSTSRRLVIRLTLPGPAISIGIIYAMSYTSERSLPFNLKAAAPFSSSFLQRSRLERFTKGHRVSIFRGKKKKKKKKLIPLFPTRFLRHTLLLPNTLYAPVERKTPRRCS